LRERRESEERERRERAKREKERREKERARTKREREGEEKERLRELVGVSITSALASRNENEKAHFPPFVSLLSLFPSPPS